MTRAATIALVSEWPEGNNSVEHVLISAHELSASSHEFRGGIGGGMRGRRSNYY